MTKKTHKHDDIVAVLKMQRAQYTAERKVPKLTATDARDFVTQALVACSSISKGRGEDRDSGLSKTDMAIIYRQWAKAAGGYEWEHKEADERKIGKAIRQLRDADPVVIHGKVEPVGWRERGGNYRWVTAEEIQQRADEQCRRRHEENVAETLVDWLREKGSCPSADTAKHQDHRVAVDALELQRLLCKLLPATTKAGGDLAAWLTEDEETE